MSKGSLINFLSFVQTVVLGYIHRKTLVLLVLPLAELRDNKAGCCHIFLESYGFSNRANNMANLIKERGLITSSSEFNLVIVIPVVVLRVLLLFAL